ncbi:hypothetical protein ACFO26_02315 [Lactococcus nasutitermitis]|uniref:DUF5648 domain-containing protein n=1 Tax=Lactococcus nasutitermitis TaxID=1652957 RepID=A0ABV9JB52_9LACT|nr:hypothetical protein [Lactococcus nasutitermitis]
MKKSVIITAAAASVLAVGVTSATTVKAHADSNVYRLYNPNTGEHFYTTSTAEKNADVKAGWNNEGIGWIAPSSSKSPVYRVYNPNAKGGDHYYTKNKGEASALVKLGWKWDNNEKPVFYSGYNTAIYVAYNPNALSGAHNYTASLGEENNLIKLGWKYKAIAWYGKAYVAPAKPSTPASKSFTKGEGTYTVGNQIAAGKYTVTSVTHSVGTLLDYNTADYSVDNSLYLDSTGKYGDKSATITLTKDMTVTIVPTHTGDTVAFIPVK